MIRQDARQGEERGRGFPRSEEARRKRHEELSPGTPLPERGAGLSTNGETEDVGRTVFITFLAITAILVGGAVLLTRRRR